MQNKTDKKQYISDSNKEIIDDWYKHAESVTPDTFEDFVNELTKEYELDYESTIHASTACLMAMMSVLNDIFGFSGYQGSAVVVQFLFKENYPFNKAGLRIIDFDNMKYPQYESYFKGIPKEAWNSIQEQATELFSRKNAAPLVKEHCESIMNGNVPFGYSIEE